MKKKAICYTDGSCHYDPSTKKGNEKMSGPGAWAYIIVDENGKILRRDSGYLSKCTHNVAELTAINEALRMISKAKVYDYFDLCSDSRYCIDGFNKYLHFWKMKNFRAIANMELWKQAYIYSKPLAHKMNFLWIKGHAGNIFNETVDKMCQQQILDNFKKPEPPDTSKTTLFAKDFASFFDKKIVVNIVKDGTKKEGQVFSINSKKNTLGIILDGGYEYVLYLNNANLEITEKQ